MPGHGLSGGRDDSGNPAPEKPWGLSGGHPWPELLMGRVGFRSWAPRSLGEDREHTEPFVSFPLVETRTGESGKHCWIIPWSLGSELRRQGPASREGWGRCRAQPGEHRGPTSGTEARVPTAHLSSHS